ncbi:hypothetical protein LTR28_011347 [Elasticomyces elasticus]|nr:hypothetical protein LTR28_011347 [Elasticomyces elasticus]
MPKKPKELKLSNTLRGMVEAFPPHQLHMAKHLHLWRATAQEAEDKEFVAARRKRPNLHADGFTTEDWQPLVGEDSTASVDGETASTLPPWDIRYTHSSAYTSLASPSTSPTAHRTVWGTAAVPLSSPELRALPRKDEINDDGWLQG